MRVPVVSVCMATYDGEAYVAEQLASILDQLGPDDEVVVVDDGSRDRTPAVVRAVDDPRVRLVERRENRGYVATFEEALSLARGEHVFLADQDDVWPPGRMAVLRAALHDAQVVFGNVAPLDPAADVRPVGVVGSFRLGRSVHRHRMTFRLATSQAPYYGSAMAVRRDLLDLALPFPASVRELHDAWFALLGLRRRTLAHVVDDVVLRRVHGSNASGRPRSARQVVRGRVLFVAMWWDALRRCTRP